jgi:hypothetical protein
MDATSRASAATSALNAGRTDVEQRNATRGCALVSRAVRIQCVRAPDKWSRHALPLLLLIVADHNHNRGDAGVGDRSLHAGRERAERGLCARADWRRGRRSRGWWRRHIADDERFVLQIDACERVSPGDHDRRVHVRQHDRIRHDVAAHAQGFAAKVDRTAGRHAKALEREELKVCAVIAGRQEAGLPGPLGDPDGRRHLIERPALAPAHRIAGQRKEIGLEIRLTDARHRILGARATTTDSGDDQGKGQTISGRTHSTLRDDRRLSYCPACIIVTDHMKNEGMKFLFGEIFP